MKKIVCALMFLVCVVQHGYAQGSTSSNLPPDQNITGTDDDIVIVSGAATAITNRTTALKDKAKSYITNIKIDLTATENKLLEYVPNVWNESYLRNKISEAITFAEDQLKEFKATAEAEFNTTADASESTAKSDIDPKGQFIGHYDYPPTKPEENKWTAISCSPNGNAAVAVNGSGGMNFMAGAAVGFTANASFGITLGGNLGFNLVDFVSVDPTSGTGKSINVKGVPKYECPWGFSIATQALLQLTVATQVTYKGTLSPVNGQLNTP